VPHKALIVPRGGSAVDDPAEDHAQAVVVGELEWLFGPLRNRLGKA
jgi:hypothetical protein